MEILSRNDSTVRGRNGQLGRSRPQLAAERLQGGTEPNTRRSKVIGGWAGSLAILLFLSLGPLVVPSASAQVSKEYQVKAVFLWRLAQFTQWPTNAFAQSDSPIIIGVLGDNPFQGALEDTVRGETAGGRRIVVQTFRRVQDIQTCHVLFISSSETGSVKEILRALAGRSILTVSDIEGFAAPESGMVRFHTEQNKVALRINLKAVKESRLALDAQLLRAAEIVAE